jgi:hypothetical protein
MPVDTARWKQHVVLVMVAVVLVGAVAGTWAFLVSLRPCRLRFQPGTVCDYLLRTEYSELRDGQACAPRIHEQKLTLVCVGADNEVALVAPSPDRPGVDEVTLLDFSADGAARRVGTDGTADEGKALGFFDFNLLPLPPGNEQDWKASLVYAALPPGERQVTAKVKRRSNSAKPEFELRLPTKEWVNEHDRYVQVRNLVCTYRFDGGRGVVDRAQVKCDTGIERDDGSHRFRVTVTLELLGIENGVGDTAALRDLAVASVEAQQALDGRRTDRLGPLIERLERAGAATPALREVAQRLRREAGARLAPPPAPERWVLQVASMEPARRATADALVRRLVAGGLPARAVSSGGRILVGIGPQPQRDERLVADVRRIAGLQARWMRLGG